MTNQHHVLHTPIEGPFPAGTETAMFGLGCFWGAEKKFWQMPDVGSQYRSRIYYYGEAQRLAAQRTRDEYQRALSKAGHGTITTEILPAPEFYYSEDYHQQYLSKNPDGYWGLGSTGVSCPVGVAIA